MFIPPGHTEESVLHCMNYIANMLAPQFRFGYSDVEDIKQEICVFCIKSLPKYNAAKGKLSTFLLRVATSRLINFRRDFLFRMPPKLCKCEQCVGGTPCKRYLDRMAKWKKINTSKRNIMIANHIGDDDYEGNFCMETLWDKQEVIEIIDEYLDVNLREDYRRLLDGVRISRSRREKVLVEIQKILTDLGYME